MSAPVATRLDPAGLILLLGSVLGWGLNWPAMKVLLAEMPVFSMRSLCAAIGIGVLVLIAHRLGESLAVPRRVAPRLVLAAVLNVTAWMGLASLSLYWLRAGEATIVCYTVPLWATLFARAILGERITLRRVVALGMGVTGLAVLMLGAGLEAGIGKLPGVALALTGSVLFALGTVIGKRWPLALPPTSAATWQVAIGCAPLLVLAVLLERPDWGAVSGLGWALIVYGGVGPLGLCYLTWFAALRRLPAAAAAAGTLLTPVVGVLGAAVFLGEPLGLREVAALSLTVGGVVLAIRG